MKCLFVTFTAAVCLHALRKSLYSANLGWINLPMRVSRLYVSGVVDQGFLCQGFSGIGQQGFCKRRLCLHMSLVMCGGKRGELGKK